MTNKRVYEIAKEMNKSSKEIVDKAKSLGFNVSNHMAVISESQEREVVAWMERRCRCSWFPCQDYRPRHA